MEEICRLCMAKIDFDNNLKTISEDENLVRKIENLIGIKVSDDSKNKYICMECNAKIREFEEFVEKCQHVNSIVGSENRNSESSYSLAPDNQAEFIKTDYEVKLNDGVFGINSQCNEVLSCNTISGDSKPYDLRKLNSSLGVNQKVACKICNVLILPKNMASHLVTHTDIYKCRRCGIRHSRRSSLENHLYSYHSQRGTYVCHFCGLKSTSVLSINRHINSHPKQDKLGSFKSSSIYKFDQHPSKTSQTQQIINHEIRHKHKQVFVYNIHINDGGIRKSYENEYFIYKPVIYRCLKCKKVYSSKMGITRHTKSDCGRLYQIQDGQEIKSSATNLQMDE